MVRENGGKKEQDSVNNNNNNNNNNNIHLNIALNYMYIQSAVQ